MDPIPQKRTYRADVDTKRPEWEPLAGASYDWGIISPLTSREEAPESDANLISSELAAAGPAVHSPVLDIDFPARLIPSSTPGHFHLYLDGLVIDWPTYRHLLDALAVAGVIEQGYANACIERRGHVCPQARHYEGGGPSINRSDLFDQQAEEF